MKNRIFKILEKATPGNLPAKIFNIFIITLIILNVLAVILGTVKSFSQYTVVFRIFEIFSVIIFTVEYILRLWSCTTDDRFKGAVTGRIKFAVTPLSLIDLMAILPFYLPMIIPIDLRFIRIVRLLRLFRIFKLGRYSDSLKTFSNVLKRKKEELFMSIFIILILLIVASSLMYFVECDAQPKIFSSIPAAMWWGVTTLTTVGYGDIYPITHIGKFIGAIIALLGIGMFALPTGIIGSGFIEEVHKKREETRKCPHCGKDID
ncbi:MAG: ion transporter [bacterium]|nr:ion transporter [bacterium]